MSKLIALVATAVMVGGERTVIQPGQELPDLSTHDERELLQSGAAENPADTAAQAKADALASTANFLRGHGWQPGAGYQQGQANFAAIQGWNAATVYQQAIAIIGAEIDGL